ncbi:MAG: hypothetical protein ACK41W_18240 [Cyanobacteriota bacterium]|jgi:hypothetical protein
MPNTLARLLVALVAGGSVFALTRSLLVIASTLISSLLITGASLIIGKPTLRRGARWALVGATSGGILGTAEVIGSRLKSLEVEGGVSQRALLMALLASAGVIGGLVLSRDASSHDRQHPRDVLRSISGLTTGLFATLVALTFLHQGLDSARAFSSRLSTALTILVATLTVPGWVAHTLAHPSWRPRQQRHPEPNPVTHHPDA